MIASGYGLGFYYVDDIRFDVFTTLGALCWQAHTGE
jgi:hypothetical protein